MATSVISSLRVQYPKAKIIVQTPWIDVWKNNPNVDLIIDIIKDELAYKKYVYGKDFLFLQDLKPYCLYHPLVQLEAYFYHFVTRTEDGLIFDKLIYSIVTLFYFFKGP